MARRALKPATEVPPRADVDEPWDLLEAGGGDLPGGGVGFHDDTNPVRLREQVRDQPVAKLAPLPGSRTA